MQLGKMRPNAILPAGKITQQNIENQAETAGKRPKPQHPFIPTRYPEICPKDPISIAM
jgi:hypothetical protein